MAMSSIVSARSFFSLRVLVLERLQPLGIRHVETAELRLPLVKCRARVIPCLRHTSAVALPASCSRRTPMICSSLNRERFIVRLLLQNLQRRTRLSIEGVYRRHFSADKTPPIVGRLLAARWHDPAGRTMVSGALTTTTGRARAALNWPLGDFADDGDNSDGDNDNGADEDANEDGSIRKRRSSSAGDSIGIRSSDGGGDKFRLISVPSQCPHQAPIPIHGELPPAGAR